MKQMNEKTIKIIFSKKVMIQLMELGFQPIKIMQNPTNEKFLCWAFEWTEDFDRALSIVLGGNINGSKY